jgi:hypothetical protein
MDACSPDLCVCVCVCVCDFYLWGNLKQKACRDSLHGLGSFQSEIRNVMCNITEGELQ